MNIKAIIYTSNTGYTKQYAEMLGKEIDAPVLTVDQALKSSKLKNGDSVVYMGWLMAGKVKGFKKVNARFDVICLCAVGMAPDEEQKEYIIKSNTVSSKTKTFVLQGGFQMDKLTGVHKVMMATMKKTLGKKLQEKQDKTDEEKDMLDLLINGGNRVTRDKLQPVVDYLKQQATNRISI